MTAATMNELDRLRRDRDALRARAQQAEEDNHQLLQLLAKIRAAAGDPTGRMMQPELIAHIQEMAEILAESPTTSLASLKATARAEAMEWAAEKASPSVAPWLKALARDYRRQAEAALAGRKG